MTPRERFIKTLTFGTPDRVFYAFGDPRKSTLEAWYAQGLRRMPDVGDYGCPQEFYDLVGMDRLQMGLPVNTGIFPPFEERTIKEDESGRTWMDAEGIVMHDSGASLATPGFRTRSYVSHPVTNSEDWLRMRERFEPDTPGRYPDDWAKQAADLSGRDYPLVGVVQGLYWKARDWVGFENLSVLFYDNPSLVHEMMEHTTVFIMEVLERALADVEVDCIILNEDMAYKHASMISPKMFREFMLPRYKRLAAYFAGHHVPIFMVDCDGHIGELLPLWIEAGANATFPVEIAAHNDPVAYRKRHGKAMAMHGAIDKREIRSRERTYKEIMGKVPRLVEGGGYLPRIDHAVPPDVPLASFLYMCELIKAVAEGRPAPGPNEPLEMEERLLSNR
jgi:uroporphyrinogen decarboxylase